MNSDSFQKYLTDRYEDQTNWYQRKASENKKKYQLFQWSVIVLSALVPVLVAVERVGENDLIWWFSIVASVLLAIGTAGVKTFKFQENWINYRSTAERLIQEQLFFNADIGEYASADNKQKLFVERVEALISGENTGWVSTHKMKEAGA